jgi:hypothetical protein
LPKTSVKKLSSPTIQTTNFKLGRKKFQVGPEKL